MQVLITGGCGFLGQVLTQKLLALPNDIVSPVTKIVLVDRTDATLSAALKADPRVAVDVRDVSDVTIWPDLVIRPAARTLRPQCHPLGECSTCSLSPRPPRLFKRSTD